MGEWWYWGGAWCACEVLCAEPRSRLRDGDDEAREPRRAAGVQGARWARLANSGGAASCWAAVVAVVRRRGGL